MFPALNLFPLNDSFIPKHIVLAGGQHVKVGRQTNAKTVPGEKNGYFDSKVLSRQHAEVWEEGGKVSLEDASHSMMPVLKLPPRYGSRTSNPQTEHLSTVLVSVKKALNRQLLSSTRTTSW
jgi:hypothetical protein